MKSMSTRSMKQRGVVLFLTLIALLAMSLAAVALIRSVDTSTLIAGNLAFKQAATSGGDAGIEAALGWLRAAQAANNGKNIFSDATHALNTDNAGAGYFTYIQRDVNGVERNLVGTSGFAYFRWDGTDSSAEQTDAGGNKMRYVIERVCRNQNTTVNNAECLFGGAPQQDKNGQDIVMTSDVCNGPGCPSFVGETPQYRITVRIVGPKATVSYVQAFAY